MSTGERDLSEALAQVAERYADRFNPHNLASQPNGAVVTASGKRRFAPSFANDGFVNQFVDGVRIEGNWQDDTHSRFPDWLQVDFPETVEVGHVVVHSPNLADFDVQARVNDEWIVAREVRNNTEGKLQIDLQQPVTCDAIRLWITGLRTDDRNQRGGAVDFIQTGFSEITEIQVFRPNELP